MTKIADIASVKGGKRLPKGEELTSLPTDNPYIRAQDIRDGKITIEDPKFLTLEQHQKLKRYIVARRDVCIVTVGASVGDAGIVPSSLDGANLTENAVKLTNFRRGWVPEYVNYCLCSPEAQAQMQQIAGGAAQPKLGIYKVLDIEIPYHPESVQERIASILSTYDDLTENNTRRIKILEQMAQMLYREWFVNFRFPGHEKVRMVESESGQYQNRGGWSSLAM
jgi:type I restriction enzyme S subunit